MEERERGWGWGCFLLQRFRPVFIRFFSINGGALLEKHYHPIPELHTTTSGTGNASATVLLSLESLNDNSYHV